MPPFHYTPTLSGLSHIYLVSGATNNAIQHVSELHTCIAEILAEKPERLHGTEFRFLRTELGLTPENLAQQLATPPADILAWEESGASISYTAEILLRLMILFRPESTYDESAATFLTWFSKNHTEHRNPPAKYYFTKTAGGWVHTERPT